MSRHPEHKTKLVSRSAWLGLACLAVMILYGLLPLARERQLFASDSVPSALSLRFLALAVERRPNDQALRLQLASKQLQVGQLDAAREHLLILRHQAPLTPYAQMLLIAIEHARWAAIEPSDVARRKAVQAELEAALAATHIEQLSGSEISQCAALYRELEQPAEAARLLDALARHAPWNAVDYESRTSAADLAWLESGQPLLAAELHAHAAAQRGRHGQEHARLAVVRARAGGDDAQKRAMALRMRELYPDDPELVAESLAMAEETDVKQAFALAGDLVKRYPTDGKYRRDLARFAQATGHELCALDQFVWLWAHEHREADRQRALELARAQWDLPLVRELLDGPRSAPQRSSQSRRYQQQPARWQRRSGGCQGQGRVPTPRGHAELDERIKLYEALGDSAAAKHELDAALGSWAANDHTLWLKRLELELRSDNYTAALATLELLITRFPNRGYRERAVQLLLEQGRHKAALKLWLAARPEERDTAWLQRTAELAAAMGDIAAERSAYEQLVARPEAELWQYQRLLELAPHREAALRIAIAAGERFQSLEMVYVAFELYGALGDEVGQIELLSRAENSPNVATRSEYWQTRITLHQARAARAARAKQFHEAKRDLERSEAYLGRAQQRAPAPALYAKLWEAQRAQALALGLQSEDSQLTAHAYADSARSLSARERVYVLSKLGRSTQAFDEAHRALGQRNLLADDRTVLQNETLRLGEGHERSVRALGDALSMPGFLWWYGGARIDYAGRAGGIRAQAGYAEFLPSWGSTVLHTEQRDISGSLRGSLSKAALELGASVRNSVEPRPFGVLTLTLVGNEQRGASLGALANVTTSDTSLLRALGVRDAIVARAAVHFGEHVWLSTNAAAEAFYTRRERWFLGWGATVDASFGTSFSLPGRVGSWGLRIAGRVAPRFAQQLQDAQDPLARRAFLPETSEWLGLGAAIGRGSFDAPPLVGRVFCYGVDAAGGWLWPVSGPGYTALARMGFSIFGGDLLTLAAGGGNVVGSVGWTANAAYAFTFER